MRSSWMLSLPPKNHEASKSSGEQTAENFPLKRNYAFLELIFFWMSWKHNKKIFCGTNLLPEAVFGNIQFLWKDNKKLKQYLVSIKTLQITCGKVVFTVADSYRRPWCKEALFFNIKLF